ncbi:lytic murein transglycosylase [Starkeya sp. 3C]|uniref:Lytic murein transglycosylase n=1 Tax=Ancylobacter moscoviensis TaxID=2597768 RepID=A0ABY3DT99_9HYPH|nr:lytic murein transglycosylase [Ancylobacter moscoviensis]TSJ63191.1 lytic murein transglycosylase [Ancylobacter moscoviensis]
MTGSVLDDARCPTRRAFLLGAGATALALGGGDAYAQSAKQSFDAWIVAFRARAKARGISDAVYDRVTRGLKPDTSVYAKDRAQPEFREELWQYLNRRISDWRLITGRAAAKENAALLKRLQKDFGVELDVLLGLWGMESAFGELVEDEDHMKPVFPSLGALAWGEPRRRKYWETEFLNALAVVQRGWGEPEGMRGSWAGAMGHTQWMPEVWLNLGVDYDGDGHPSPYSVPDALAGSARYLIKRGNYQRGLPWGFEVTMAGVPEKYADARSWRTVEDWAGLGVKPAGGGRFQFPKARARLWAPVGTEGPCFLLTQNFYAVRSYNPSMNYALAVCHLGDRVLGGDPFITPFPGGERVLTLAEIQEVQRRLTKAGFDTGGVDGRVGNMTMRAVAGFQRKVGLEPDGYASLDVLAALRKGR